MADSQVDLSGARILVVDDVPENLEVLLHTLEEMAYEVLVATRGETALELAASGCPDLILLDVMMPGIDGYETCRRLKADSALEAIPVIFLTARDDIEGVVEGFDAGGADYIVKPFRKQEMLARIRTHLERMRLAQELTEKNRALAEFNVQLEQMVDAHTRELRLKVYELEGKDRIAQHLLAYHSTIEETLELVLEIIVEVMALDRAIVYLEVEGRLKPAAAIGVFAPGAMVDRADLDRLGIANAHQEAFALVRDERRPVHMTGETEAPFALVPILRGDELLGVIQVAGSRPVTEGEAHTLSSFALQAAVAISDLQVQQDTGQLRKQLEDALGLDDMLAYVEPLDEADRDGDG